MKSLRAFRPLRNSRVTPGLIAIAALLALQFYSVREFVAAEALFALAFISLGLVLVAFYLIGSAAERTADAMEAGLYRGARQAQREYRGLEGLTRKWIQSGRIFHAHR